MAQNIAEEEKLKSLLAKFDKDECGVYHATSEIKKLSYPEEAREKLFSVENDSFWFQHRNNILSDAVKKWGPRNCVVVDVGGGNGVVAKRIQDDGHTTLLIEPGEDGARNGALRGVRFVFNGLLSEAKIPKESLGAILACDVIEHLENDAAFLKEAGATLSDDGVIIFTVPASNLLWSNEDVRAGHYRRYSRKGLMKLLTDSQLETLYVTHFFSYLYIPILMLRAIPSFFGIGDKGKSGAIENDLSGPTGAGGEIVEMFSSAERSFFNAGHTIPFGSSILAVAKKK